MRMSDNFDKILDECIDCINQGKSLESCLTDYPQYAEQLEPLLRVVFQAEEAYSFQPSAKAKRAAQQRFEQAREELARAQEEKRSLFPSIFAWSKAHTVVAAVTLATLIGYFGLVPMLSPTEPTTLPDASSLSSLAYNQDANFAFLISDERNDIEDFTSLNISILKIGLHLGGEAGQWIGFEPELAVVDLTLLQGDNAQEIWRGNVPKGQYTKVLIYVDNVSGILADSGDTASIKLPSNKLLISKPFTVGDSVVNFVYDVTIIETGKSGQYTLKPQIAQSGADKSFKSITPDGKIE